MLRSLFHHPIRKAIEAMCFVGGICVGKTLRSKEHEIDLQKLRTDLEDLKADVRNSKSKEKQ